MSPAKDLGSDEEEHRAFLPQAAQSSSVEDDVPLPRRHAWRPLRHFRLILECFMAVALVGLLLRPPAFSCRSGRRSPVPECKHSSLFFFSLVFYLRYACFSLGFRLVFT